MKRATSNLGWAIVVAGLVSMAHVEAQKGKPLPPPVWPCTVVFGDFDTHKIRSDEGGEYVNGVDKVQCIVRAYNNNIGNDGNLFVNASGTSPRWFEFPDNDAVQATPHTGYVYFQKRQPGYFEITDIYNVGGLRYTF